MPECFTPKCPHECCDSNCYACWEESEAFQRLSHEHGVAWSYGLYLKWEAAGMPLGGEFWE